MLFFPSHDIALGNGVRHFNPPAAAVSLQNDLAWLAEIWNKGLDSPLPWGWDWDTREYIARHLGIKRCNLPDDSQLEALRQLSSRRSSITILRALGYEKNLPQYLTNEQELTDFVMRMDKESHDFVLKTPWSSSGRGLIRSTVTPRSIMMTRAMSTVRKMGGIMAERWHDKVQDFAMLFFIGHDGVSFVGYSLFDNEESGTYRQGYLLSNDEIERRLSVPVGILHTLRGKLKMVMDEMFSSFFNLPWQVGFAGIDMITYHNSSQTDVFPCIELNLRCTMGVVARLWFDQHMTDGQTGRFIISPMQENGHFEAQFIID